MVTKNDKGPAEASWGAMMETTGRCGRDRAAALGIDNRWQL